MKKAVEINFGSDKPVNMMEMVMSIKRTREIITGMPTSYLIIHPNDYEKLKEYMTASHEETMKVHMNYVLDLLVFKSEDVPEGNPIVAT